MSFLDLSSSPLDHAAVLPTMDEKSETLTRPREAKTITLTDTMREVQVPRHPIPSMQGAFAESFIEAGDKSSPIPSIRPGTAASRRKLLLDQDIDEETHASRWRQRPGQRYHELWKLMAQISFGIYLLLNGIAKDEEQVMRILQGHVNEVDEFLETTLEDFDLAQEDIDERLKLLKLPLENIVIFDAMLEDRDFRLQIVGGNEKIEHVITRTARAMKDALQDVKQGLEACREFATYLAQEQEDSAWKKKDTGVQQVFDAMKGNVDGWWKAYVSLQTKGNRLGIALVQLGSIVAEMDRRAGEVSRKIRFSMMANSEPSPPASPPQDFLGHRLRKSMSKTLPHNENLITPAIEATLPAFQLVQDRERTPESDSNASSDVEDEPEPEPTFILKPHTYSPMPSPRPLVADAEQLSSRIYEQPPNSEPEPQPSTQKRSSLRQRLSFAKKDTNLSTTMKVVDQPKAEDKSYWGPTQRVQSVAPSTIRGRQESLATPPSRGLDSAYCSDLEKASPQPTPSISSHQHSNSRQTLSRNDTLESPPSLTYDNTIPSPRSEQQYFRPVNASPHSPLQRPWTASPEANPLHAHSNSSSSNISQRAPFHHPHTHTHTPSTLGNRRGAASSMGMSMDSTMTVGMDEEGKKVKKKRSAFGWLKKAFSLSEEERAAFEERRKMQVAEAAYYAQPADRWVDGKRVTMTARRKPSNSPLNARPRQGLV